MSVIIGIALIVALGYYLSLRIHPLTKCKRCNGAARHYNLVYSERRPVCPACGGTGRQERLGVRLFRGGTSRLAGTRGPPGPRPAGFTTSCRVTASCRVRVPR